MILWVFMKEKEKEKWEREKTIIVFIPIHKLHNIFHYKMRALLHHHHHSTFPYVPVYITFPITVSKESFCCMQERTMIFFSALEYML